MEDSLSSPTTIAPQFSKQLVASSRIPNWLGTALTERIPPDKPKAPARCEDRHQIPLGAFTAVRKKCHHARGWSHDIRSFDLGQGDLVVRHYFAQRLGHLPT